MNIKPQPVVFLATQKLNVEEQGSLGMQQSSAGYSWVEREKFCLISVPSKTRFCESKTDLNSKQTARTDAKHTTVYDPSEYTPGPSLLTRLLKVNSTESVAFGIFTWQP